MSIHETYKRTHKTKRGNIRNFAKDRKYNATLYKENKDLLHPERTGAFCHNLAFSELTDEEKTRVKQK